MSSTLCALFAFVVTFCFLYEFILKRKRLVKMMEQFDGPPVYPVIGNCSEFVGRSRDVLRKFDELVAKYKKRPWRLWLLHKPYVLLTNPADIQIVAYKTLEKDSSYSFIAEVMGNGIFTSKVEKWKHHRQLLNPAFNPLKLADYFLRIFNDQNEELVTRLSSNTATDQHFDLWPYISATAVNTISETAIGREETYPDCTIENYGYALTKAFSIVSRRLYRPLLHPSFIFTIYKRLKGYDRLFRLAGDYPMEILKQKRHKLLEQKANPIEPDDERGGKSVKNFISTLFDSMEKSAITDEDIRDEVVTIISAGSETTALIDCFVLLMLAMRPEIQDKVYEEIYQVFGDSKRRPTSDDLNKLPFLEICIKETLRRFPIVPIVGRYASEDIPISDKYVIPAGATVVLCIMGLHHDRTIYPKPLEWNPSNFDPQNVGKRPAGSYIPFSVGPRGCIGQKYAYVSIKALLSTLLRNYKFSTDVKMSDIALDFDLLLRSARGYNVKIESRRGTSAR